MSTDPFVHLHLHTEFSMLDGAARIGGVMKAAAEDGQPAVGITDHGNMYGVLDFYKAAHEVGLKPIIGMEGYFEANSRFDRPRKAERETFHLTMLAETDEGYKNLIKISSAAYLDGFFYKPRLDFDLLERYGKGIIATSGCLGGLVCQQLLKDDFNGALEAAGRFQEILGKDNFFVEIQDHDIPEQHQTNPKLVDIAQRIGAPLLATNDLHYVHAGDAEAHDALLCVQTGATRDDPGRLKFHGDQFWLKPASEMRHLFRDYEKACDNTLWIAERADVEIAFGRAQLPQYPLPEGHTEDSYLRFLTEEGARQRYGEEPAAEVKDRIDYELQVISDMGFSAYFLVVWDLIKHARDNNIRVGPGRGSAAGCCVAYCLKIVDLDPIRYGLFFERFLNPGRKEMPDIDMDFDERYRSEMIRYAAARYGADHVAQIITFSTIKARAAVRDASRVLGYPYALGDKVAKLMPPLIMGRDTPLYACFERHDRFDDGYKMAGELRELYDTDPDVKKVVDVAMGLEGLRRQDGIHAAAVVITREPLTEYLPIQRKPAEGVPVEEAPIVTQYEMHGVESLGLLKMDFLGLRNLSVIDRTLELIKTAKGIELDIDNVPLDDGPTFEMLRAGMSIGVFQLEGGPMRALMRSLAPTAFEDVAALVALYRPGPMGANMHTDYADRKNGRKPVVYYHPALEEILGPTYGLMIYQEQMMQVAQHMAGYSLAEADNLRKATGKKKRDVIAKERVKFVAGCDANGYGADFGEKMFDVIEPFADYSFNKSHSFGYGFVSYQTAYLKAHHPVEYLAALLTSVKDDKDKTAVYLNECRLLGVAVLVPDVNTADSDFVGRYPQDAPKGVIPFGMSAVRNVGEGLVSHVVAEREANGPFTSFADFCMRAHPTVLNKRALESLIKGGAFDSLGHPRKGLLAVYERIADAALARRREAEAGIMSLFGDAAPEGGPSEIDRVDIPDIEFDKADRLAFEKEMLGLYVSDHPLMGAQAALAKHVESTITEVKELQEGSMTVVGGVVTNLNRRYTKRGDLMATLILEDLESTIETMIFPRTMSEYGYLLQNDSVVCIKGRVDRRDDQAKLMALEITVPDLVEGDGPPMRVRVQASRFTGTLVDDIKRVLEAHKGESPIWLHMEDGRQTTVLRLGPAWCVNPGNALHAELRVLLGADAVF